MKWPTHMICIFEFSNNTFIRVAVPYEMDKSFEAYLKEAKGLSWNGNECDGRGELKSFTVANSIHV